MKPLFRLVFSAIIVLSLCSVSCNKTTTNNMYEKDAVLTGFDQRACPCCGGLMINFTGDTKPYSHPFFLIENDAATLGVEATANFPIHVKVNYTKLEKCGDSYVRIDKIEKK